MFAQIYTGCDCGETWNVEMHTDIDIDNDEIVEYPFCTVCGKTMLTEKTENGVPCYHALTAQEIEAERGVF